MENVNKPLRLTVMLTLLVLLAVLAACGRDHRQGASDIRPQQYGMVGTGDSVDRTRPLGHLPGLPNATPLPSPGKGADGKLMLSPELAAQVAAMEEVEAAEVIVLGNIAYVAVTVPQRASGGGESAADGTAGVQPYHRNAAGDLSDELSAKIAEQVMAANAGIRKVYASANADFVERIAAYADNIRNGVPANGFFQEIGIMIRRLFPEDQRGEVQPTPVLP